MSNFALHGKHATGARRGALTTPAGEIQTPFFMPIATKGAVKTLAAEDVWALQQGVDSATTPIVLSNTYHLYLKPGLDVLRETGGLHPLMNWNGAVLTDSGGFQIFSLEGLRTLTDDGVEFQSHLDGSKHMITPEKSMEIQSVIGSNIWMAFDYFPGYPAERSDAEHSVQLTTEWARRCKQWSDAHDGGQQLFGIVQGSTFGDLRAQSARELQDIGFDGYAIGGLAVGEPAEVMYEVLEMTTPHLPEDVPRYLMGVGTPEQILEAVKRGVDMFDCVIPTRNARHGSLFVHTAERIVAEDLSAVAYEKVNARGAAWASDTSVIDPHCECSVCAAGHSRAYLRHLFAVGEPLAARMATIHNVTFYMQLMKELRDAIV